MNRVMFAAAAVLALSAAPAFAAASPAVEAAAKTLEQIAADATKLQGYCKLIKDMEAAGEDEAKFDAVEQQMRDLLRSFGPQYEQAMDLSESTDRSWRTARPWRRRSRSSMRSAGSARRTRACHG